MSQAIKNGDDGTLSRNSLKYMKHLVNEYELTKSKSHPRYRFVQDCSHRESTVILSAMLRFYLMLRLLLEIPGQSPG